MQKKKTSFFFFSFPRCRLSWLKAMVRHFSQSKRKNDQTILLLLAQMLQGRQEMSNFTRSNLVPTRAMLNLFGHSRVQLRLLKSRANEGHAEHVRA